MSTPLRSKSVRPSRRTSAAAFTADPPEPEDPLLGFAPYLHVAPRRNSITPERQRGFIAALAASGIVTQAARAIGVSLEALYKLRHLPGAEAFSAAWDMAIERGIGRLEDCALELAIAGEELPIVSGGQLIGTYRKHNFGHIRFLLSQRLRGKYGGSAVSSVGDLAKLDPADPALRKLREQWQAEYEAEQRSKAGRNTLVNEAFLVRLNQRITLLRDEALACGAMRLLPDGSAESTDPELRAGEGGEDTGGDVSPA